MNRWSLCLLLACLPLSPGCHPAEEAQDHDLHGEHTHAPQTLPTRSITVFSARTELFAEHPALVVGRDARFAAHLTQLKNWSPVTAGRLEVVLSHPTHPAQIFYVDAPSRPGIFQPIVTPREAGTYKLAFRLTSPTLNDTIQAGDVVVHADAAAAQENPEAAAGAEAISYLKEQQWKMTFKSEPVASGSLETGITLQGSVKPAGGREAAVVAPADGRIVAGMGRQPQLGDKVSQGHLLAVLTPTGAELADRITLREALQTAETQEQQARLDLARADRLVAAQAAPAKRLESAKAALALAQARLEAARHHLRVKEAALSGSAVATEESFMLKAPLSGTVVAAAVVPGAQVEAGTTLYRLIDMSSVWVEARAPEAELARLAGARRAAIAIAGAPAVLVSPGQGGLVAVGSVLDLPSRTAPITYAVPNPHGHFRIGMTAQVQVFTGKSPPGPILPASAVIDDNGRPIAYVQTGGESFERRELLLGARQGERVQVLKGIQPEERVVTRGGYEIRLSTLSNAVPAHGHEH